MLQQVFFVGMAGAFGTLARFGLQSLLPGTAGAGFPWSTLAANGIGCFIFGLIWGGVGERFFVGAGDVRNIVLVGFLGAFTTFSSLAAEGAYYFKVGQPAVAAGYLCLQICAGLVLVFAGLAVAKSL
ncbi:MAG TPA: chromosome condensation protein CrcB [Planctomycetes bacterium]|nr:chromosome condensation protein CrcB [Planctomycetota bacterium]